MSNPYQLRFDIWQQAQGVLMDKFMNDHDVWNNWQFDGHNTTIECPVKERPVFPTNDQIREEAEKIYNFVEQKD